MISPCKCKGSVGYVHESCLLRWMKTKYESKCEICGDKIKLHKQFKPINKWILPKMTFWDFIWPIISLLGLITSIITICFSFESNISMTARYLLMTMGCCTLIASIVLLVIAIYINMTRIRCYVNQNQIWRVKENKINEIV
uniref:E3 ubiquitin-protein ligase MARCH2 (Trinotate prediction) n=1 Tax=Henneguya salminicola TaxID=69463 RepID=A0A6G3MG95_HENSL